METKPSYEKLAKRVEHLEEELATCRHADAQLRESEEMARTLLNATSDAFVLLDAHGIILDVNKNYAQRFDKKIDDMLGHCIWNFLPPEITESRKTNVTRVFETGKELHLTDKREGLWSDTTGG